MEIYLFFNKNTCFSLGRNAFTLFSFFFLFSFSNYPPYTLLKADSFSLLFDYKPARVFCRVALIAEESLNINKLLSRNFFYYFFHLKYVSQSCLD